MDQWKLVFRSCYLGASHAIPPKYRSVPQITTFYPIIVEPIRSRTISSKDRAVHCVRPLYVPVIVMTISKKQQQQQRQQQSSSPLLRHRTSVNLELSSFFFAIVYTVISFIYLHYSVQKQSQLEKESGHVVCKDGNR